MCEHATASARAKKATTSPAPSDPEGVLPDRVFKAGEELEFLKDLDFLVIALPLTSSTDGLIGERKLQALPKTTLAVARITRISDGPAMSMPTAPNTRRLAAAVGVARTDDLVHLRQRVAVP